MLTSQPPANSSRPDARRLTLALSFLLPALVAAAAFLPVAWSARAGGASLLRPDAPAAPAGGEKVAEAYGELPLGFEANVGQTDGRVRFIARGLGYQMFLTPTEAVLALRETAAGGEGAEAAGPRPASAPAAAAYRVLRMRLAGADAGAEAAGLDELPGKYNYFVGNDPAQWRTDVPLYARAEFRGVYRGIDLVYYGNQRQLEYDFNVAAGADPRAIRLEFDGAERVEVGGEGDLVLKVRGGEVRMRRPVIYQLAGDGARHLVEGRYVVRGRRAAFEVGAYDRSRPLVIDPVLAYASYLGAASSETGYSIAVDSSGSAYVTGHTSSFSFPAAGQTFIPPDNTTGHAFVTKLNPAGTSLVYSTLIGGSAGDSGSGIAVDASGSAYVTGVTTSTNFPLVNAFRSSASLSRSTDGGASWAASNAGLPALGIRRILVSPASPSTVYASTFDFLHRSTDGGLSWSRLNTNTPVTAVALDPTAPSTLYVATSLFGNNFISKSTDGGNIFTTLNNSLSGTVVGLAVDPQNPSVLYAGILFALFKSTNGGATWAQANTGLNVGGVEHFAFDPTNSQTVYAGTSNGVFKTTNGGGNWARVSNGITGGTNVTGLVLDPTSPSTLYAATFNGGVFKTTNGAADWAPVNTGLTNLGLLSLALDPTAPATLYAGTTRSSIFKMTNGGGNWTQVRAGLTSPSVAALAVAPTSPPTVLAGLNHSGGPNSDREAFVSKLSPAGNALAYSTYLGGGGDDDGNAIAVNSAGQAHVVGTTASADFPLANPRQAARGGLIDAFVTKLDAAGNALVYSTYLGGGSHENGRGAAVDPAGNAYVTGDTLSNDFPATPGAFQTALSDPNPNFGSGDAFVTKLDPTGSSFVYSTYLGGSNGRELGFAVAADSAGNAYVAGATESSNFPLQNPAQAAFGGGSTFGDAFASKLNPAGTALVYSTYLGGTGSDDARGIAVAPDGAAVVAGSTGSNDFPVTPDTLASRSGLFRSTDAGATWDNRNSGLRGQVVHLAVARQAPGTLYAATTAGVFKSTDGGRTWAQTGAGLPCCLEEVAVDPKDASVVYAVGGVFSTQAGVYKSTNGGASWAPSNNNRSFFEPKAVAVDPVSTNVVYVGASDGVSKSTNGGASWAPVNNGLGVPRDVRSITIDPANPATLYATVGSSSRLYKTTDGGASWTPADTGFPVSAQTFRVAVDPANSSALLAATTAGVLKSADGGATWAVSFNTGFTSDVAFDPQRPGVVYASLQGAPSGVTSFVYRSDDGGATWQPTGGPRFRTHGLAVDHASTVFGFTDSVGGGNDLFVTKLSPAGSSFLYSTYLGGTGDEFCTAVAADAQGNAYVTGQTRSPDFPVTPEAFQVVNRGGEDAFVAKVEESFTISGTVTSGGAPQPGVKVTLSGDELRAVTTGADGAYAFSNLRRGGGYTVSATKTGFSFTPPSHAFGNLAANQTADFTAAGSPAPFHTISGRVTEAGGAPVPGVTVRLEGSQIEFTTTDASGNYSFTAPAGGNYTLTPGALGFTFAPPSHAINGLAANQTADFTAARQNLVVTNTNDHGAGSLRQAITDANAIPGRDRIVFNIPGAGVKTISPDAALPELTAPVEIDAATQPGYAGSPLVELDGSRSGGNNVDGLLLSGGNSVVRALAVFRFNGGSGVELVGDGNVVEGCYLGITASGAGFQHSNHTGLTVRGANNRVGGTTAAARNVISGNSFDGVAVFGANNQFRGNYVGTNPAGSAAVPNGTRGIEINGSTNPAQTAGNVVGGTEPGAGNVISGNGNGNLSTRAAGTVIQGNFIGTDATGTFALGSGVGISLEGRNTTVGGTAPGARNVISGQGAGINISTFSNDPQNVIQGNFIGTDVTGTLDLGNSTGIEVNSPNASIGGTAPGAGNVISGNLVGIHCRLGSAVIRGNRIGTDAAGNLPVENQSGVLISSNNNVVGGAEAGAGNVISGNIVGVQLGGNTSATPTGNVVQGNLIGTNAAATGPLPNTLRGVGFGGASGNLVGGDEAGAGNLIAFNGTGLALSAFQNVNNRVLGNSIFSNALLGIDLNADFAVTPNDALDADTGPNNLQNFPVLSTVTSSGGTTHVRGALSSAPDTQFRVDFYSNLACDSSGHGEGARPFGSATVTTDSAGHAAINVDLGQPLAAGRVLTATATDPAGNTSEFSPCDASKAAGSVAFEVADMSVLEDVGSALITVVRRGGGLGPVSVNFATADATAAAGADYTPTSGTLTFAQGETAKTFAVPVANDGLPEPEETVRLTLGGAAEPESLGAPAAATLRILDADTPLALSVENPNPPVLSLPEGDAGRRSAPVTVRLSAATSRTVTVDFATTVFANNATPGADFVPVSGTLTFPPGAQRREVLIPILGDTLDENNETFGLGLANAVGASAPPFVTVISITDDDALPAVSVTDLTVIEGPNAKAVFAVRLSAASGRSVPLNFFTADGTAAAGSDYAQTSGALSFAPGETVRTVEVPVVADSAAEPDEAFALRVAPNPTRAAVADGEGVATITESASASAVQFGAAGFGVSEADGFLDVTVTRAGDTSGEASVAYETISRGASEKSDYTAAVGRVRFAPGEGAQTFRVLVTDDAFQEPAESLDLVLSSPSGAALGGPSAAVLTITSDDASNGPSPVKDGSFDPAFFVRQHYADFLGRVPDQDGLNFWVGQTTACGASDPLVCRINVSAAFFLSIEYQESGYLVHRAYKAAFGDLPGKPVPLTLGEFLAGSRRVGEGVQVGVGDWQQRLEANKNAFFEEFVTTPRFTSAYPAGMDHGAFVEALNQNVGGALSQAERDALVAALGGGTRTRAQVLRAVAEDAEFAQGPERNRAFVLAQYFGYLRRDPDDIGFDGRPDPNFEGYNFWLNKLNQFDGNFIRAEMVKAFIQSIEYGERFGR